MKKERSFFGWRLLAGLNSLFALLLLISYLAFYIPPSPGWFFGLLGLAYPVLLIGNAAFVVVWVVFRKKYILISLITILMGWNHIGRHVGLGIQERKKDDGIKVMSYNIQGNRYRPHSGELLKELTVYLNEKKPKIICLQEFFLKDKQLKDFLANLQLQGHEPTISPPHTHGLLTYTSLPVMRSGGVKSGGDYFAIYHDMLLKEDTVRVYNMQLASIHLQQEKELFDQERSWESTKSRRRILSMFRKFNLAYTQRTSEVEILKKHIAGCDYPVILCGDFNDTPLSYTYRKLSQNMQDPFRGRGSGFGNTHNENLPPIRIDYILHDETFDTEYYSIDKPNLSDHFPVIVVLSR